MACNGLVVALEGGIEVDEGLVDEVDEGLVDEVAGGADAEVGLGVDVAGAGVLLAGAC